MRRTTTDSDGLGSLPLSELPERPLSRAGPLILERKGRPGLSERAVVLHDPRSGALYTFKEVALQTQLVRRIQSILPPAPGVSNEGRSSPLLALAPLFLGPEFQLGARWNRLVEAVKTRKKREKTGKKWARYGLKRVKEGG